jgi:hypothetical protein
MSVESQTSARYGLTPRLEARDTNEAMKIAAAEAIAGLVDGH